MFLRDFLFLFILHYLSIVLFESMFLLHPKTSSISLEIIFYAWLMVCQNWFVRKLTPYSCVFQNLSLYIAKRIITISEVLRYTLILIFLVAIHKWRHPFFKIFDPSLPLVTHFIKYAYGVTSPFGRCPLPPK